MEPPARAPVLAENRRIPNVTTYSGSIASKMRLANNKELARRMARRIERRRSVEDRKGHSVEVVQRRRPVLLSNGLVDE